MGARLYSTQMTEYHSERVRVDTLVPAFLRRSLSLAGRVDSQFRTRRPVAVVMVRMIPPTTTTSTSIQKPSIPAKSRPGFTSR